MSFIPEAIYIEEGAEDYRITELALQNYPNVPVYRNQDSAAVTEEIRRTSSDVMGTGKNRLFLSRFKGSFLKKCPGISKGMVCCNYYIVNLIKNCIYDCSYCFLQDFLENNPLMTAYVNVEDLLLELDEVFAANPDSTFRVGTGELTDSLALEEALPYSDILVPFFNEKSNAVLELKTKSDQVANLLKHENPQNVIISWSINPQRIVELEEKGTPSLAQRLESARLCYEKGYKVGFHFDPIILFPGWEEAYAEVVDALFASVPPEGIEWISLGSFRFRPNLKSVIKDRHSETRLFTEEHVPCEDGKYRYLRSLRNEAYSTIREMLLKRSSDLSVYMCMETKEIWEGVTGKLPRSDEKLDQFFDL
ncbi:MAG: SPL family radical SAM protein [Nitrospinales bacterium]